MEWKKHVERNEKIRKLLTSGESISHIAGLLNLSKSTVFYYSKRYGYYHSDIVKDRIKQASAIITDPAMVERHYKNWGMKRQRIIDEAIEEWKSIRINARFMSFIGIYWGEGNKRNGHIGVVNNDPGIIKFSYNFIKEMTKRPIDIIIRYYPEQDKISCKQYWEKLLGTKVQIKEKRWLGKKRRCWSEFGIAYIRVSDWRLYIKIITWISLWRSEILGTKVSFDAYESIAKSGFFSTIEWI
jgi:hypothetical protein